MTGGNIKDLVLVAILSSVFKPLFQLALTTIWCVIILKITQPLPDRMNSMRPYLIGKEDWSEVNILKILQG
jgi:hypothetical protein